MAQSVSVLLFDLGKVILDFDYGRAVERLKETCDKRPEELMALFYQSNLDHLFEEGRISPNQFFEGVQSALGLRCNYETFVPIWNEIFTEMPDTIRLLEEARRRYRLFLISNTNVLHFDYVRKEYPVLAWMEGTILSHEVHCRKPSLPIFEAAIRLAGVRPEEIFYTDDHPEFVEAAGRLGIRGAPFTSAALLRQALAQAGVILNGLDGTKGSP